MKFRLNRCIAFVVLLINGICLNIASKDINCGLKLDEGQTVITEKNGKLHVNVWLMPFITEMEKGHESWLPVVSKQYEVIVPLATFEVEINGITITKCKDKNETIIFKDKEDLLYCHILSNNNLQTLNNAYKKYVNAKQVEEFAKKMSEIKSKL